ncbi:hypothetical protein [Rhizobium rhizogenes]|uniref:hypothetical protein n=1 Tax=Rhizobium rhizogenes TaxID=359 RepID=UPI0004D48DD4|nr:hypothetical protein [Rhizobium rhizogenes]KEA07161.1 hypothetical protein CN09_09485 [Rhizobium rhizogenes]NTI80399.1 hypothetical protein [Rhizobium rhizogenes]NTJ22585.1 hypothetical protein [Rhizobium rhizogenes]QUE81291.1 hypothetical protein EML492_05645 [Rhizobium rhizogenes]TQO80610.1 hypothetical protein FFE80_05775 [Rhizobium rhizogenes]
MTDKIDNGGPAFPVTFEGGGNNGESPAYFEGMTLRDWFAGQALAESTRGIWDSHKYDDVAKRAYGIADAMISARKGGAA